MASSPPGRRPDEDEAVARLHGLLLRAARFEVGRRRPMLTHLRGVDFDDIAMQAADDALMSVLRRLDDFRGGSRFTTWVYKFALLEAGAKLTEAGLAGPRGAARARVVERVRDRRRSAPTASSSSRSC